MKLSFSENVLWKGLFFGLLLGYCFVYAPYGVNETDGGFLTGLAWQVLNGKTLYQDLIYVRPPLPVWLRALELQLLPEHWGILGERWIFYSKLALYSWLGAALLETSTRRWILATFGFVLSAHCYPAMAWHTVDGILFTVLAAWLFFNDRKGQWDSLPPFFGGISLFLAMLCKQSFYPMLAVFGVSAILLDWKKSLWFFGGFLTAPGLFFNYLSQNILLDSFFKMTNGAASAGQAVQHGILDYFRITPELALPSMVLLGGVGWLYQKDKESKWPSLIWGGWLFALVGSYTAVTWLRQEHTAPFAQSRAMFWVATTVILGLLWHSKGLKGIRQNPKPLHAAVLLGITWCATISWGYSLPMLFTTPWVWAAMEISGRLRPSFSKRWQTFRLSLLLAILLAFRVGYEFVYRDGNRTEMTVDMGIIFPKLSGIYSSQETVALYRDLKALAGRYGANFTVLPAFPQANYLTGTVPPLPLDWVVNRETNGDNQFIFKCIAEKNSVFFIEKKYLDSLQNDPELAATRRVLESAIVLEETRYFKVIRPGTNN